MTEKPIRFQFSLGKAIVLMIIAGILLAIPVFVYKIVNVAGQAERTLHATTCVFKTVDQYVKDHPGQWPKSWDALRTTSTTGFYAWPRDDAEIMARVDIDFNARLDDLTNLDVKTFKAIRPKGPCYLAYDPLLCQLLETIRADVALRQKSKAIKQ